MTDARRLRGARWIRRVPAEAKLLALAGYALLVGAVAVSAPVALVLLACMTVAYLSAGLGVRALGAAFWRLRWVVLLMAASGLLFMSAQSATAATARLLALLLAADLLTATTPATAILRALELALRPLRPIGVDPARTALTMQLAMSAVPVVSAHARRVREAQTARGVRPGWRSVLPMLVLSLRHADDVGDALQARGLA